MTVDRRQALTLGTAAGLSACLPGCGLRRAAFAPEPGAWRAFETVTRLEVRRDGAGAQAWVPVPAFSEDGWARGGEVSWTGNAQEAALRTDGATGARFVHAVWTADDAPAGLVVTAAAASRDRAVRLDAPRGVAPLSPRERALYTRPTALIPTDGIVAATAADIVGDRTDDLAKARAIYDWVVENSTRNPLTRGCGPGDVATMLLLGDLSGKCADINGLYVGLARAAGLPARDLYGLRVAPSAFGYRSLGTAGPDVTRAQHCRADVWVEGIGWVPADPADVRKVMLEEEDEPLPPRDRRVRAVRGGLFGAWEGNWIAFNDAHDVALPRSRHGAVPFLMYPQAEVGGRRLDPLDPDGFSYRIEAREGGAA